MFVSSRWQRERKKEAESIQQKIKRLDDSLFEGKKYKVRYIAGIKNGKGTTNFEGTLIKKMDKYYIFKSILGYKECFLKIDFIIREYSIEEVG